VGEPGVGAPESVRSVCGSPVVRLSLVYEDQVHPELVARVDGTRQWSGDTCGPRTSGRLPLPRKWRRGTVGATPPGQLEQIIAIGFERRDQINRCSAL
jgi:hypothetical protein